MTLKSNVDRFRISTTKLDKTGWNIVGDKKLLNFGSQ